jgi:hypothetical protein
MMSDTLFDSIYGTLRDVAHYAVDDAMGTRDWVWYEPDQYDEVIRRLTPLMDLQIAYDTGCNPMPVDRETEDHLMCWLTEMIVDIIQENYGSVE